MEDQVEKSGFSTPSEYVRALIREDQKRRAEERVEELLLEALRSGEPIAVSAEYWERKRKQLVDRGKQRKGKR